MALRIHVHDQHSALRGREKRRHVDGREGLPTSTLLVDDSDRPHSSSSLVYGSRSLLFSRVEHAGSRGWPPADSKVSGPAEQTETIRGGRAASLPPHMGAFVPT